MTLEQLANAVADYDAGNLSRFERGMQGIDEGKLRDISAALQVPISTLYVEVEDVGVLSHKKTEGGAQMPNKEAIRLALAIETLPESQRAALRALIDSFPDEKHRLIKKTK